jgi:hypothetical protein
MKKIAAITMARNDEFFLNRWIKYYGTELGEENLYIYLDGTDQKTPSGAGHANITKLPHTDMPRSVGDKYRIGKLSDLAADLFARGYDIVIGCDCDEFLITDPNTKKSLRQYLSDTEIKTTLSGLGLDMGQDLESEKPLDLSKPFLQQRKYAMLSKRYTKPVVLTKPRRWGSGFHSVKKTNFHIDNNLYLLHFGFVDFNMLNAKKQGRDATWAAHLDRQIDRTLGRITRSKNRNEKHIKLARIMQRIFRPIYAWNKPGMLGFQLVTTIPTRFRKSGV